MDCIVFGHIAGEHAAENLQSARSLPKELFEDKFARYKSCRGPAVQELMADLNQITEKYLGVLRNENGLKKARVSLRHLYHRSDQVEISSLNDIKGLIELEGGIWVALFVCEFALAREESRGAHYRKDFPSKDPQWQHSQFAGYRSSSIKLRSPKVEVMLPLQRVSS